VSDSGGLPLGDLEQRIVMRYAYDMLGNRIHQLSMEAGARWMLNDVAGKPIRAWDSRGHDFTTSYDALRRPTEQYVRGTLSDPDPLKPNSDTRTLNPPNAIGLLVDKIEYGEPPLNATPAQEREAQRLNLRTRIYRHFASAGVATNAQLDANGTPTEAYDFKGNSLHSTRQLVSDYKAIPDWLLMPQLDAETFESSTRYDALNRSTQSVAAHSSVTRPQHPNKFNIAQPVFNEANLLERVHVWLERVAEPSALLDPGSEMPSPVGVAGVDYDAKGQRLRIDYKNGASTFYRYDSLTFRLTHLLTRRDAAAFPGDDPQPVIDDWPGKQVQNLHYSYDPAGNITHIRDDAQQTIYFRNQRVEPSNDYVYDALYRLIQASGREHLGQQANGDRNPPAARDAFNGFNTRKDHPNVLEAMGTYIERYVYDAVGNFWQVQHRGGDPAHAGWTRAYDYLEPSLIEDGSGGAPLKTSNRLTRTTLNPNGANPPLVEPYQHDAHGNMMRMPHLGGGLPAPNMHWEYRDRLRQVDRGGGSAACNVYDASGERVRKVWEKSPGLTEERIYLGGFEIFRTHGGAIGANTATLERETLHVMDDKQRIALVETRTLDKAGDDQAPRLLIRYQIGNHLGSACLELDGQAQVISYEEYAPYGSSTYQAVRSQTETAKRYRYTGKERDEENGFYYHRARYYAAWLGVWISVDPAGVRPGLQRYGYCRSNPIALIDQDGQAPYEWADWLQAHSSRPPGSRGEDVVQNWAQVGEKIGRYITDHPGTPDNSDPAGMAAGTAALVSTVVTVAGTVKATLDDPEFVIRGILRFGTGFSQGADDIAAGNTTLGVSRIVGEGAQGLGIALGGVSAARAFGVPGTYKPTPAPVEPAAPPPAPTTPAQPAPAPAPAAPVSTPVPAEPMSPPSPPPTGASPAPTPSSATASANPAAASAPKAIPLAEPAATKFHHTYRKTINMWSEAITNMPKVLAGKEAAKVRLVLQDALLERGLPKTGRPYRSTGAARVPPELKDSRVANALKKEGDRVYQETYNRLKGARKNQWLGPGPRYVD
jgi:RHS repeat-associated protein